MEKKIVTKFWELAKYISFIILLLVFILSLINVDNKMLKDFSSSLAEGGTMFLVVMLISRSIYLIIKNIDLKILTKYEKSYKIILKMLRVNATEQRNQGLVVFNLYMGHSIYFSIYEFTYNTKELITNLLSVSTIIIVLFYMLLTSYKFFQKRIIKWKYSHSIIWIIFPFLMLHVYINNGFIFPFKYLFLLFFVSLIVHRNSTKNKRVLHFKIILLGFVLLLIHGLIIWDFMN